MFVDGTENWIVYHAMAEPNAGWLGRTARAQKFYWNPDNSPNFGRPRGFHISLDSPSTDRTTTQIPTTQVPTTEDSGSSSYTLKPVTCVVMILIAIKFSL